MTTKQYMQQYYCWKSTLANRQSELKELDRDMLPAAVRYDTDKVQHSVDDGTVRVISQMQRRRKMITSQMESILGKMQQFEDMIDELQNGDRKRLLHLYYVDGVRTLKDVADIMGYSLDRINHMHGEALNDIGELIKVSNKLQDGT